MKYLLDTNICIHVIKERPKRVLDCFLEKPPGEIGISSVAVAELMYGAEKSAQRERNRSALDLFLAPLELAAFDFPAAKEYGEIRAVLEKDGTPVGAYDLMIAAQARALGVTLVTNNVREFRRVPGLVVENWAA